MRGPVALLCVLLASGAACGQPADCPVEAAPSGETMPLLLDLSGMPGVPRGLGGYVGANIPMTAPGMACADDPPEQAALPADVLRGTPGDVLGGEGSGNVLGGGRAPRVEIIDVR